ncbi:hypothetical protein COU37_00910 [Candidatus Micrarchaeota archaeon CG10_big_fil_rev_8_21_14_0_10_45_29]|nr:MAG: hypothetical protein COU37_00910 [Candidatus Micrarchaeota archaeon CG10_big_fil_rev_8_21_14_0_10_45_29]
MQIIFFSKIFALFTALAMIGAFAVPFVLAEYGAVDLLFRVIQFEALALALSIVSTFAYPHLFGVQKGEKVLLVTTDPVANRTIIKLATALESGKLHKMIKIGVGHDEMEGEVESYAGIISPAKVKAAPEENIKVI